MFRTLPAATWNDDDLKLLASKVSAGPEDAADADKEDGEENFGIPAGYTYFGQFVDHDLTFDPTSALQQINDPDGLVDFRTPRFDLDSLYGRGPDDQPYLYADDGLHILLGRPLTLGSGAEKPTADLQRNGLGRALIGDKRNDENVIVSQFHAGVCEFHNHLADIMRAEDATTNFEDVAREVRFHYQWAVLHDFLKRLCKPKILDRIAPHINKGTNIVYDEPHLRFYHFDEDPFIPIEFSVAAYRLGHSMVRPVYRLSLGLDQLKIFGDKANEGLNGFREFPANWGIDWSLFFGDLSNPKEGAGRIMPSYKIDTSLVDPLSNLPEFIQKDAQGNFLFDAQGRPLLIEGAVTPNLSLRNLMRGRSMSLPSGQTVACAMGFVPLRDDQILIGKATASDWKDSERLANLAVIGGNGSVVGQNKNFAGKAPLWIYILAEAAHEWAQKAFPGGDTRKKPVAGADRIPVHLGDVGSTIIAETFLGLMKGDSFSYLKQNPMFVPRAELTSTKNGQDFSVFDLVRPRS